MLYLVLWSVLLAAPAPPAGITIKLPEEIVQAAKEARAGMKDARQAAHVLHQEVVDIRAQLEQSRRLTLQLQAAQVVLLFLILVRLLFCPRG